MVGTGSVLEEESSGSPLTSGCRSSGAPGHHQSQATREIPSREAVEPLESMARRASPRAARLLTQWCGKQRRAYEDTGASLTTVDRLSIDP